MKDHGAHATALEKQTMRCLDALRVSRVRALELQALANLLPFNRDTRRVLTAIAAAVPQLDAALSALVQLAPREDVR